MNYLTLILKYKWIIGLAASLITIASYHYIAIANAEEKGYRRAITELRVATNEKIQEATNQAISAATKKLQEALAGQQVIYDTELKRATNDRVVEYKTNEIIKYIDRVTIKTECSITGDDIIKLLNDSVNTNNAASDRSPSS